MKIGRFSLKGDITVYTAWMGATLGVFGEPGETIVRNIVQLKASNAARGGVDH